MTLFAQYRKAIGLLVGLIFGAGIFALPAAVAHAGIGWGIFHFALAFILMLILQLWFAEIAFLGDGHERFPGFVRHWIGKRAEKISFVTVILGYYGSLLVYGILGGIFLHTFLPSVSLFWLTIIFFVVSALISYFHLKAIGRINFILSVVLIAFVFLLSGMAIPHIDLSHFQIGTSSLWFLPYGVFLFAFGGLAGIPEASAIMRGSSLRHMRFVIIGSMAIAALLYAMFIFAVVGVTGSATTDDALQGLIFFLGNSVIIIGAVIGLLAVFTSNLALATDLKNIYRFDYGTSYSGSWLLSVVPAAILFLLGASEFLPILSFVGAVTFGVSGLFIFLMARNFHKSYYRHVHPYLNTRNPTSVLVAVLLIAGALLEVARFFDIV